MNQLLNALTTTPWESWPKTLRKHVKAVSMNSNGMVNSLIIFSTKDHYFRKGNEFILNN